jgi:hypothetical protein
MRAEWSLAWGPEQGSLEPYSPGIELGSHPDPIFTSGSSLIQGFKRRGAVDRDSCAWSQHGCLELIGQFPRKRIFTTPFGR